MKTHLNITLNEGSSYNKIRESILAFDTATTKWNESAALSLSNVSPILSNTDGPVPMEVDRVQKGKGGKDQKGKGKDAKSKGKGKDDKGKGKSKGGKFGGGAKEGKGKGAKDNKGGKGKGNGEVCWTCGKPGHQAKDCWRARQVEAPATQSVTGSSQHTTSPSTTTSGTGGEGDQSTTAKSVRRVSQPAVFDLPEASTDGSIRVAREATVEFYNISTDDEDECERRGYAVNTVHERMEESTKDGRCISVPRLHERIGGGSDRLYALFARCPRNQDQDLWE